MLLFLICVFIASKPCGKLLMKGIWLSLMLVMAASLFEMFFSTDLFVHFPALGDGSQTFISDPWVIYLNNFTIFLFSAMCIR
jgi:hypothetical protein